MGSLNWLDGVVIGVYFVVVFGVAFWAGQRDKARDNSKDYFLAGRNTGWFIVGASLFASNIGSEHLVGLAGTGAASGVAVAQFEVLASLILLLLGWFFGVAVLPLGAALSGSLGFGRDFRRRIVILNRFQ